MQDLVIIGGGPGGYAAALYAHNFDLSVTLVEKDIVGGTCLVRGCIPAKHWLHTAEVFSTVAHAGDFGVETSDPTLDWAKALERKQEVVNRLVKGLGGLLKGRGVEVLDGYGKVAGQNSVDVALSDGTSRTIEGRAVVLATGSVPRSLPGFEVDGHRIVTSDHALDWPSQPARVAIIGAGAIGLEFASLLADLGSEVHVFELMDQVVPGADADAAKALARQLERRGVKITTGVSVGQPQISDSSVTLTAGDSEVEVDVVLVAVGRAPATDGLGLEEAGVEVERGYVLADLATMQTAVPSIYAVGDIVAGTPQLAHAGFAEAIAAVTHIATGTPAPVNYRAVPLVVYTAPEMASVGLTESEAREAGIDVEVTKHQLTGVGRAIIMNKNQGMTKVIAEKGGPILGASIVGPHAGELVHELMYAVGWEALPEEAAALVHAHPTLSEVVGETLLSSAGTSLH